MIRRYSRETMENIWSEDAKFSRWLTVELSVLETLVQRKIIPKKAFFEIRRKAKINVERIEALEKTLHHDVIAFTTSISEMVGESARYFHYGLTSSDVVDSALSLAICESLEILINDVDLLLMTLKKKALQYKKIPTIGRTHGVHAEPTSFGLKFLGWFAEFSRQRQRLEAAKEQIAFGKLSGAVGAYGILDPDVEKSALRRLKLSVESVSTQVLPRDRHAQVFQTLAGVGASIERVAVELRHLQRTEVLEVQEGFSKGQKGSSAMPHKRNPISAENLCGCARVLRGYSVSANENVALWHERDISHSSVERIIAPDGFLLADYMLVRLNKLIEGLTVNKRNVAKNLSGSFGIFFSGHLLLALVDKGMSREESYQIVQKAAHYAWDHQEPFESVVSLEPEVRRHFSKPELKKIFRVERYLQNVDAIYSRVFKKKL